MPAQQPGHMPAPLIPSQPQRVEAAISHPLQRSPVIRYGTSLALLGHAADYLRPDTEADPSRLEAAHLLRRSALQIFEEYTRFHQISELPFDEAA